jgi:hypothetical protein
MQLDGKPLPIDIHLNAATRTIGFNMRRGHPAVPEQVRQFFRDNPATPDNPVTIQFEGSLRYIPCRADIALLRIGYLAMFKQLGYRYILSPAADVIRRIVMNYENPPAELGRIILGNVLPAPTRPLQFGRLKGDIAVLVVMTLIADSKPYYYGAVMPSRDLEPCEVFPALRDAAAALHKRRSSVS